MENVRNNMNFTSWLKKLWEAGGTVGTILVAFYFLDGRSADRSEELAKKMDNNHTEFISYTMKQLELRKDVDYLQKDVDALKGNVGFKNPTDKTKTPSRMPKNSTSLFIPPGFSNTNEKKQQYISSL